MALHPDIWIDVNSLINNKLSGYASSSHSHSEYLTANSNLGTNQCSYTNLSGSVFNADMQSIASWAVKGWYAYDEVFSNNSISSRLDSIESRLTTLESKVK